jgi:hypothetical protein
VAWVFGDSAKRRATLCPSGVRLNFGSESFETFHGGLVETFVEVSVDVENGAGALVTETVGDVAGRLSFGDEHGHMGMAQIVGGARVSDRGFDGGLPVAAAEAVVVASSKRGGEEPGLPDTAAAREVAVLATRNRKRDHPLDQLVREWRQRALEVGLTPERISVMATAAGKPDSGRYPLASFEPRHGRTPTGRHLVRKPTRTGGRHLKSPPVSASTLREQPATRRQSQSGTSGCCQLLRDRQLGAGVGLVLQQTEEPFGWLIDPIGISLDELPDASVDRFRVEAGI